MTNEGNVKEISVLYEDNHFIAVNKNISDLVQGDITGDIPLAEKVKHYIKLKYNKPGDVFLGVSHRLDRPVSGVVLFAKTSKALSRINNYFRDNKIKKIYWAIVKNKPPEDKGSLIHYLVRNTRQNKSYAYERDVADSKRAVLNYNVIYMSDNYYFLEIELVTGRHHQIRSQLSRSGCPVKGDLKYNFPGSNKNRGIDLHARELSFIHPVKKEPVIITAPPPKERLWDLLSEQINDH